MSEVLEIEVDGEIDDGISGFEPERRSPRWGLPAAIALVGVLLLAVLVVVVLPALKSTGGHPDPPKVKAAAGTVELTSPISRAQGALSAWGRFAVSGDLEQLTGWFAPEGPQYRMLADEAERLSAGPPGPPAYSVDLTNAVLVSETGNEAKVRTTATWTRGDEDDQHHRWDVVLRRVEGGRWLLWTVDASGSQ